MKKEYIFNSVKYGYSLIYKKWAFIVGTSTFLYSVKGGKETG